MEPTYLIDSNIIIYLINGALNAKNSEIIAKASGQVAYISVISKMEILGWNSPVKKDAEAYQNFINDAIVLNLSDAIVEKTIAIRKANRIKLPDAIIGATAVVHDFTLLTRNISDFLRIPGLIVINPFPTN